MQEQLQEFAKAAKGAACTFMGTYGGTMTKLVPYAYAGGPKLGSAAMLGVGIANWAAKENCEWDPDKQGGNILDLNMPLAVLLKHSRRLYIFCIARFYGISF